MSCKCETVKLYEEGHRCMLCFKEFRAVPKPVYFVKRTDLFASLPKTKPLSSYGRDIRLPLISLYLSMGFYSVLEPRMNRLPVSTNWSIKIESP
jgi:hypothetical protein